MTKKILVFSAGWIHPSLACRFNLKKLLNQAKDYKFTYTSSLNPLIRLSGYDAVVLYFHRKEISDSKLAALEEYVNNGGGILALHAASASFKQSEGYFNLIGGRFNHHGPITGFEVNNEEEQDGIFAGIPGFEVTDELYIHNVSDDITVHFSTKVEERNEPVVWTRKSGQGKVAYCSLGHRAAVLKHPHYKEIILRCFKWFFKKGEHE